MKYCPQCGYPLKERRFIEKPESVMDLLGIFVKLLSLFSPSNLGEPSAYRCPNCKKEVLKHFDITGKED